MNFRALLFGWSNCLKSRENTKIARDFRLYCHLLLYMFTLVVIQYFDKIFWPLMLHYIIQGVGLTLVILTYVLKSAILAQIWQNRAHLKEYTHEFLNLSKMFIFCWREGLKSFVPKILGYALIWSALHVKWSTKTITNLRLKLKKTDYDITLNTLYFWFEIDWFLKSKHKKTLLLLFHGSIPTASYEKRRLNLVNFFRHLW